MSNQSEILTPPEAAAYLKLSTRTLAAMRATGGGPAFSRLLGNRNGVRYRKVDLDVYVDGCRALAIGVLPDAS